MNFVDGMSDSWLLYLDIFLFVVAVLLVKPFSLLYIQLDLFQ